VNSQPRFGVSHFASTNSCTESTVQMDTPNIPLESAEGQALLASCEAADRAAYDALWPHFTRQRGLTMCGLSSLSMVLRSLPHTAALADWSEEEVLARQRCSADVLLRCGATLRQLEAVARSVGLRAERSHVPPDAGTSSDAGSAGAVEAALAAAVRRAPRGVRVLCNYNMSLAGQPPYGGHFSPIGAFHAVRELQP